MSSTASQRALSVLSKKWVATLAAGSLVLSGLLGVALPAYAEEPTTDPVATEEIVTPTDETPAADAPADEVPAAETPADEVPAEDAPEEDAPAEESPAEGAPADDALAVEALRAPAAAEQAALAPAAIEVSQTTGFDPAATTAITVTGSGFTTTGNVGTRPPLMGVPAGVYVVFGKFADTWKPSAGALGAARTVLDQKWAAPGAPAALAGNAQYVPMNPDGTFTVSLNIAPGTSANANYGIYTYPASGASNIAEELYVPISFRTPSIDVSQTTGFDPAATTPITVTGSGFTAAGNVGTRPPLMGVPAGVYVVFGKFADTWKPSAGALGAARTVLDQKWAAPGAPAALAGNAQYIPLNADGSFTATLNVAQGTSVNPNYGIYTYPASGASNAAEELYVPISFRTPAIQVSQTSGFDPAATTPITVTGSGFTATGNVGTRPPLMGVPAGVYVVFGKFADTWKPSAGALGAARTVLDQKWAAPGAPAALAGNPQYIPLNADGTFTATLNVAPGTSANPNYGIYTYPASGASNTAEELYVPISFDTILDTTTSLTASPMVNVEQGSPVSLVATVSPADATGSVTFTTPTATLGSAPVTAGQAALSVSTLPVGDTVVTATFVPDAGYRTSNDDVTVSVIDAPTASAETLTWGVKESFRNYVSGSIAHGTITTSGITTSNGLFVFNSATGGTFDGTSGTANFAGSVNFTGHGGQLNLTLADPIVRVDSANSGVLLVSVDGGEHVEFATLDLAGATKSTSDETITWAGAAASLTAAGANAFSLGGSPFYAVGTALDPVTFVVAAPEPEVPAVATTLALAAAPVSGALVGSTVTLTATVSPAAAGTVEFRAGSTVLGTRSVADGSATITFAPSASGIVTVTARFTPTDAAAFLPSSASRDYTVTAPVVAAGSLTWGVKASFRDYVTSGIAQGAITTSGVGSDGGAFVFGQSTGGSFNGSTGTSNYSGSVRFTGHGGLLDLSLANPVVSVESSGTATLYVTVNGGPSVPFATLNLGAGVRSTAGNAVAWSGVPATLTSVGATAFSYNGSAFYAAGTALDPVSFVIGSASAPGGGTQTVAAYQGEKQPPATPPATTGITVTDPKSIVAGGEITITAEGFQSNEEDIMVVIYSTPVVLARDATADAAGTTTWTGRLPAGLTGTHTLTLQGSVNRGVVLDIPADVKLAATGCPVQSSTLEWGFKESFRSYISGSIANGEWTVADGATYETPTFGWIDGEGSYDTETGEGLVAFLGSITFTGHGGILNTTVSNPQVQFIDADSAVILVDISGTTQEGAAVDLTDVQFVELDTTDAITVDGGIVTITDAAATLTSEGSEAFGTYEAGEAFDPVTIELGIDPTCATIAPDADEPTATPDEPVSTESNLWWLWLVGGLVLLGSIIAVIVLVVRRRQV